MKKILVLILISLSTLSMSYAASCTDITSNLWKGSESSQVKLLQQFLFDKGLLKATPNGYFGNQTFLAVKAYQKSAGIIQTGSVYALTRAAIKKESCANKPQAVAPVSPSVTLSPTTVAPPTQQTITPAVKLPVPAISSIDYATFISGGKMDTPLTIRGSGFSSSTNRVLIKLSGSNRTFDLGNFPSASGTTTVVSAAFISNTYPCGAGCTEFLPIGTYTVIVKTDGGESNEGGIIVRSVTTSSQTGSLSSAIKQQSTQSKLGSITISANTSLSLEELGIVLTSTPSSSGITNLKLKDELTGETINGSTSFDLGKRMLYENQSKIYSIYADVDVPQSLNVTITPTLKVKEFIGNNFIYIGIPTISSTISG